MGSLYFNGWRQVRWENIEYLTDIRDRVLTREPLYPKMIPSIKLDSLGFYRSKDYQGGNFITYVKDVTIEYDVVVVEPEEDIDDEATWSLIKTETERKRALEEAKIKEIQELKELEARRVGTAENNQNANTEANQQ